MISQQIRPRNQTGLASSSGFAVSAWSAQPAFYGANALWDSAAGGLVWVDRLGPSLFLPTADGVHTVQPPQAEPIAAMWPENAHDINLLLQNRLLVIRDGRFAGECPVPSVGTITATARDATGEVWVAVDPGDQGEIVSLGDGRVLARLQGRLRAMAWSQAERCLYGAGEQRGTIYRIAMNGEVRILARIPRVSGEPRGLGVDPSGALWVALYDGWSVARLSAEGEIDRVLALPVPRPTDLTFGGADGWQLYVTTARHGLSLDILEHAPLSGLVLEQGMR